MLSLMVPLLCLRIIPRTLYMMGGWTLLSEFSSVVRADLFFDESIVVELK